MNEDIRRHPNGPIDFDFYRTRGVALRRQAMRDAGMRIASAGASSVMAGALGFAIVIPSTTASIRDHVAAERITLSPSR